jgi:small subunit ribosomal protein S21
MVQVYVNNREPNGLERALKKLKTKIDREGILDEVRLHRNFLTPNQKKKAKEKIKVRKSKQIKAQNEYNKNK